jgi:hypothetical protein
MRLFTMSCSHGREASNTVTTTAAAPLYSGRSALSTPIAKAASKATSVVIPGSSERVRM